LTSSACSEEMAAGARVREGVMRLESTSATEFSAPKSWK
jgi:hypothetical protein